MATSMELLQTCPVCFEVYNDSNNKPMMLPCGHALCNSCAQTLQENNNKECPVCKQSWGNIEVSKLVVCYPLIWDDNQEKDTAVMKCSEHDFDMIFWCSQCREMICKKCASLKHKKCPFRILEEAVNNIKGHIIVDSAKLQSGLADHEVIFAKEEEKINKSLNDAQFLRNYVDQMTNKLKRRKYDISMMKSLSASRLEYSRKISNGILDITENSIVKRTNELHEALTFLKTSKSGDISISTDSELETSANMIANFKVRTTSSFIAISTTDCDW